MLKRQRLTAKAAKEIRKGRQVKATCLACALCEIFALFAVMIFFVSQIIPGSAAYNLRRNAKEKLSS
jgi:hypothetical protein